MRLDTDRFGQGSSAQRNFYELGRFSVGPGSPPTQALSLASSTPGSHLLEVHLSTTTGTPLPPVVLQVSVVG